MSTKTLKSLHDERCKILMSSSGFMLIPSKKVYMHMDSEGCCEGRSARFCVGSIVSCLIISWVI
jgi:hypothetical protein